ncbi:MAG: carboxypeptidase M32 [Acholeplasmatales bacterium]|jgi:carboxypeptidase Taq|nr:carboxypeptidase M32 [Acholeplasmatales bacterium]
MQEIIKKYYQIREEIFSLTYAGWVLNFDHETNAPEGSLDTYSKAYESIYRLVYEKSYSPERLDLLKKIFQSDDSLIDEDLRCEVSKCLEDYEQTLAIPKEELIAYNVLLTKSESIWAQARQKSDFSIFEGCLQTIIDTKRKFLNYLAKPNLSGYDIYLDAYEKGLTTKDYDHFFDLIKKELVPFILKKVHNFKNVDHLFTKKTYPVAQQAQFSNYLAKVLGYDLTRGEIRQSVHPFTSGITSKDTRITTRFLPHNFESNIFSTMHEMGHAIFEQQINPAFDGTILHSVTNMALHESQSRFLENIIGRGQSFWIAHYPQLIKVFKNLKSISMEDFLTYINTPKLSKIRIEADEFTYPLHVLVRYEIEKVIFSTDIKASQLPKLWNDLYLKYLGVEITNDQEGILQDIHWAGGSFGYFPTYALGSAFASQFYQALAREIDVEKALKENNYSIISKWLKEHIHQFGASKNSKEIILGACGENFNPQYYLDYLKGKFH